MRVAALAALLQRRKFLVSARSAPASTATQLFYLLLQFRYFGFNFTSCCVCYRRGGAWWSSSASDDAGVDGSDSSSVDPASSVATPKFASFSSAKDDDNVDELEIAKGDGRPVRALRRRSSSRGEEEEEGSEKSSNRSGPDDNDNNNNNNNNNNNKCFQRPPPGRYRGAMEGAGAEEVVCLQCVRWSLLARFILVVLFIGGGAGFAIYAPQMVISEEFALAAPRGSDATKGYDALTVQCESGNTREKMRGKPQLTPTTTQQTAARRSFRTRS